MATPNGTFIGNVGGVAFFKDASGCFYYDEIYGAIPALCPVGTPATIPSTAKPATGDSLQAWLTKNGISVSAALVIALIIGVVVIGGRK